MAQQTGYIDNDLWKSSWAQAVVSNRIRPEGFRIMNIQYWLSALSCEHKDFSCFLKYFEDVTTCRWWYIWRIYNFSWTTLNIMEQFQERCIFLHPGGSLLIFTTERFTLFKMPFFIHILLTALLPNHLVSCKKLLQLFLTCTTYFYNLLLHLSCLFLDAMLPSHAKLSGSFLKNGAIS